MMRPAASHREWVTIGLMSGTSLDGLDAVAVRWQAPQGADAHSQDGLRWEVLGHACAPYSAEQRQRWLALNRSGPDELHQAALAGNALSLLAADTVARLLDACGLAPDDVAALGLHGQTVRHQPQLHDGVGYTVQVHQAALLAERCGIGVVADFRSRDVAAGGQGAPLVPAFHAQLWQQTGRDVAVLNLGGMANLTLLHADGRMGGFDCGPGNVLLDAWCHAQTGQFYDAQGAWAAQGQVDADWLSHLQSDPYFAAQPPKSTGRDWFDVAWLQARLPARTPAGNPVDLSPADRQATLSALTAWAAVDHLQRYLPKAQTLWVCGGGALNSHLMVQLEQELSRRGMDTRAAITDAAGVPPLQVEGMAFAWLALRFLQGLPGNCPEVTGARGPRVLGAWYPAR